ncbi:MAG: DNA polymerase III subunit beta [Gammaproteobacteria bacterium]|nr:MAG: DNA polymerase III subunit beta [Gammaproteobacteria bacterium]TND03937.1 MAG: DNA polymerase III subunit beta [Gammaproteobacteria bacterium]
MKFTINREALLKPLQAVAGVVERRQTLPILSNVLISVKGKTLSMTATDLEVEMVTHSMLNADETGDITLPARKFLDICRALPDQAKIELIAEQERAVVRSGKSRFVLATLPVKDFPNLGAIKGAYEFNVPQKALKRVIERTQFAMAQQDVRYYLNGLMLELGKNRIRVVATDGHRLALCDLEADLTGADQQQVIIPRKGVVELARLLDDVETPVAVSLGSNHIRFTTDTLSFTSKLVDGRFPDYQHVVPQGGSNIVIAERDPLKQALVRASILSNEKYRSISFQMSKGSVRILARNPEQEEAEEEVAVDYKGKGLDIGFNASYMLDALSAVTTEQVRLSMTDANSCCLVEGVGDTSCKYVVMPMRL